MVIDFHTHIFPDKIAKRTIEHLSLRGSYAPYSDGSVAGLLERMREGGVDISVTLPVVTNPAQFDSINRFAAEINEAYKEGERRLISFAGIHPACDDVEGRMREIAERGFRGIKLHPDYQDTFFDDEGYVRILTEAKRHGLIVVTHSGFDGAYVGCEMRCTPDRILRLLDRIGGYDRLVLAHYGANEMAEEVYAKLAGLDVYFDTAFMLRFIDCATFVKILEKHGDEKILFASDSPWSSAKGDIEIIKSFGLSKETEERIFAKNAMKLLGI